MPPILNAFRAAAITAGLIGGVIVAPDARAQETAAADRVVVVFDGSGSMWGGMPGASANKLAFARNEISRHLGGGLQEAAVGLVTFGARSNGSCGSVETAIEPGHGQSAAIEVVLQRFNPQGRGPIVLGLKAAVEALGGADARGRLLLVHDGPDNCGGDVCAFGAQLAKDQPNVRVDVLSLAQKPDQQGGMTCLARATGGQLIEATTAAIGVAGLDRVVAGLTPARRAPAEGAAATAARTPEAGPPSSLQLVARLASGGDDGAPKLTSGLRWQIERVEPGSDAPQSASLGALVGGVQTFNTATVDTILKPAQYRVRLETATVAQEKIIDMRDGQRRVVAFELEGGLVSVDSAGEEAAIAGKRFVTISKRVSGQVGHAVWAGPAAQAAAIVLPAGSYRIVEGDGLTRRATDLNVASGKAHKVSSQAQSATLTVQAVGLSAEQQAAAVITIDTDHPAVPGKRVVVARSSASEATFALAAGSYRVTLSAFGDRSRTLVILAAGQSARETLRLEQLTLTVSSHAGDAVSPERAGVRYRLWRSDALDEPIATSWESQPTFHLAPGRYRIESRIGLQNAILVREFDVQQVGRGNLELRHDAGRVTFELPPELLARTNAYWQVTDRFGRQVWRSFALAPELVLAAGTYTAAVTVKKQRMSAKFVVVKGQQQTVALDKD